MAIVVRSVKQRVKKADKVVFIHVLFFDTGAIKTETYQEGYENKKREMWYSRDTALVLMRELQNYFSQKELF